MEERDDFKTLFDSQEPADLPKGLEDKIMANVHAHESLAKKKAAGFSRNLGIFILSLTLFSSLMILVSITGYSAPLLTEVGQVLLLSTAIFFILWLVEISEGLIAKRGRTLDTGHS